MAIALSLGVVTRAAPTCVPLSFGRPLSYDGVGSYSLLVGDLNRDGRPDLVTDFGAQLNRGGGRFGEFDYIGDGGITALADLNGDGAPDIVADDHETSLVGVHLNRGDGTFAARRAYPVGLAPIDVAIGDLNGDGAVDLATANKGGSTASVLINRGDGSFSSSVDYFVGSRPGSVAIRDLDGNGRPDLVISNVSSNTVSALLNRGDGTFQPRRDYGTGPKPSSASIVDLNADGHPDLVTGNKNNTVSVLINRGDGTFQPKRDYATGRDPSVVVGDLNGDGAPDLATANFGSRTVSALRNHGDGTFAAKVDFPAGAAEHVRPVLADLNGDGATDLIAAHEGCDLCDANTAVVLLNRGDGRFEKALYYATGYSERSIGGGGFPMALAVADLNADSKLDVAATNLYYPSGGDVAVMINTPGLCNVQPVARMPLAAARQTLARVHCRVGKVRRAYSKRVKKGRIISQWPGLGEVRRHGARVDVVVSKGRPT